MGEPPVDRRRLSGRVLVLTSIVLGATAAEGLDARSIPEIIALDAPSASGRESASATRLVADFDEMESGKPPDGFSTALTGGGGPPVWVIQEDPTAPSGDSVLAQTASDDTNYRFPVCVYDGFTAKDLELSVAFKPISGRVDQAAGLVWRYRDAENYYVVRANALEENVVLYKVENGKRSDLKPKDAWFFSYGKKAPVPAQRWSTLRVGVRGQEFSVWLNGEHLFDVEDDTFSGPGKVGLWTKADSVTAFDSLTAKGR